MNQVIYQYFCGRDDKANMRLHRGAVFSNMKSLPWKDLIASGVTHVYLLGVFDYRGPLLVTEEGGKHIGASENRVPSLFAIQNHQAFHPTLGTAEDMKGLLEAIHGAGGKVLVDFVPNQTNTTHPWVQDHPDYYLSIQGEKTKAFSGDVYLLDYGNLKLRREMKAILHFIAGMGFDGVRCDMAHLVPEDFWREAITEIKDEQSTFEFIAEAYSDSVFNWNPIERLIQAGFDGIYHEFLYRNLKQIFERQLPLGHLLDHLNYSLTLPYAQKLVHYLANHDDMQPEGSLERIEALMALCLFMPGMVLLPHGWLQGNRVRLAHHTIEILPEEFGNIAALPQWFTNLVYVSRALKPTIESMELIDGSIVQIKLTLDQKQARLWLNLGPTPWQIAHNQTGLTSGLLHRLQAGDQLPGGKAELCLLT